MSVYNIHLEEGSSGENIDHASKLLAGLPGALDKVVKSAADRATKGADTYASKAIREGYVLSAADYKKYSRSSRYVNVGSDGTTVSIKITGKHVPLMHFDTKLDAQGNVLSRVKRTSSRELMAHVFKAAVNDGRHVGVFQRKYWSRFPITEKLGPSIPQMIDANEGVRAQVDEKIREVFNSRLEHETNAILNGYRR